MRDAVHRQDPVLDPVVARAEDTIDRPRVGNQLLARADYGKIIEDGVDRFLPDTSVVVGAVGLRGLGREELVEAVERRRRQGEGYPDHVEVEVVLALLVLYRIDLPDARLHAYPLEILGIGSDDPLEYGGVDQELDVERGALLVDQLVAHRLPASGGKEIGGLLEELAVASGAVALRR